jgi:hypothetical protein
MLGMLLFVPALAMAQEATQAYQPVTSSERVSWLVKTTASPGSLSVQILPSMWDTRRGSPSQWERNWKGLSRRYADAEAVSAISNGLEAGFGGLWGEDPRFFRSGRRGLWSRVGYAAKTAVMAPRRDGHLAPAWGRYIGSAGSAVVQNAWLPRSAVTPGQTARRSVDPLLGRLIANLWQEFWPDLQKRVPRTILARKD